MTPLKISHLSMGFIAISVALVLTLGAYMLHQLDGLTGKIQQREEAIGREEIAEGFAAAGQSISAASQRLAEWDETRQQLAFDEYYALWRDNRVRDAGFLPKSVDAVALYSKQGWILAPSPTDNGMPAQTPAATPVFLIMNDYSEPTLHQHVYFFQPVFADPSREILMGYLGVKFDLLEELDRVGQFRFADIDGIAPGQDSVMVRELGEAIDHIRYHPLPNPSLQPVRELFETELQHLLLFVIIILGLASFLLHRVVVRPLRAISQEIDALQSAARHQPTNPPEPQAQMLVTELERVRCSFRNYQGRLAALHGSLEQSSRDFYEQARSDALTGSYNRRAMEEDWELSAPGKKIDGKPCALLLFDCDHFKAINDTYGHGVGDSVIKAIAERLQASLRQGDRLYRIGGDEFATFLPATGRDTALSVAERCLEQVRSHDFKQHGLPEPVSISIGVSITDNDPQGCSLSELQRRADLAMYDAKRPGSHKIVVYHPGLGEVASLVENNTLRAVFAAIENPELFEMHYQPIMRLPDGGSDYAEALARIRSGELYLLPAEIFPIVHTRRLDTEFDLAVIRAVTHDMHCGRIPAGRGVAINVSAPGIVHAGVVSALLALRKEEHERKIVIEITETALITQMSTASNHVGQLRDAGFLVALDDFGSGYSSLRYLSSMPVDIVKFDISMIRLLDHDQPHQRAITEDIAGIVKAAGYQTVAEGVENKALLEKVTGVGFDYAQGFYFEQ